MRAFAIDRYKTPGSIHDLPTPEPDANEILVKLGAAGVNPVDWKTRDGDGDKPLPLVLGQDFAGTVERVGADVHDVVAGDRVFGMAREHGAYAEYTAVANDGRGSTYAKIPGGIGDDVAAALPTAGLTALAALVWLGAANGSSVVIVGATGGVGAFAVQLARERGARVIAVVKDAKRELATSLGAAETIAYDREDVVPAIEALAPGGVDAVLDLTSDADTLKTFTAVLKPGAKIVSTIHVADEAWFTARGFGASNIALPDTPQASPESLEQLAALVSSGSISVKLERTAPLADAASVLEASKAGTLGGKAVLVP